MNTATTTEAATLDVTVQAADLLAAVRHAAQVVTDRSSLPILRTLLLSADARGLTVSGTDLDVWASAVEPDAIVGAAGEATVPARALLTLLSGAAVPTGDIRLRAGPEGQPGVVVEADGITADFDSYSADDWPPPGYLMRAAAPPDATRFTLASGDLRRLLDAARPAISTEEVRYYLNGVFLHATDAGVLRAVATDGHRLHIGEAPLPAGAADMPGVIIPRAAVTALLHALDGCTRSEPVEVAVWSPKGKPGFSVAAAQWRIEGRAIDGKFPDYAKVIPATDPAASQLIVRDAARFGAQVEALGAVLHDEGAVGVLLRPAPAGPGVRLIGERDGNRMEVVVPETVAVWDGPPITGRLGFQARYLRDLCGAFHRGFMLQAPLDAAGSPALVTASGGLGALMPMRFAGAE